MLLFGAVWNSSSRKLEAELERIGKRFDKKLLVGYVDMDYAVDLFYKYDVRDIPTTIIFEDGEPCMTEVGYTGTYQFDEFLDRFFGVLPDTSEFKSVKGRYY